MTNSSQNSNQASDLRMVTGFWKMGAREKKVQMGARITNENIAIART